MNVDVSSVTLGKADGASGRSLLATKDVPKGAELLKVPR